MSRNFGMRRRHDGLHRAFDLSTWAYFMDFALVPLAAGALLAYSWHLAIGAAALVLASIAGLAAWTLVEYWIHRLLFHGATPFAPMHDMHHRLPKDMIGAASWLTFIGFAGVWLAAQVFIGAAAGAAFTAGFMLGYLFYCAIHVRMHHGSPDNFSRYTALMFRLHAGHHRGGRGNFGVSSPLWDLVFNTYRKASL